MNSILKEFWII